MHRRLAILAAAVLATGCRTAQVAEAPPEPAPPPPAAQPDPPPMRHVPMDLAACVIEGTELKVVTLRYDAVNGDSLTLDGRLFREAYPVDGRYAANAPFFINNETVTIAGRRYPKYGLPRVLGVDELERAAEFEGVGVYVEKGAGMPSSVYYLPVRPGCVFQPYQIDYIVGGVRG